MFFPDCLRPDEDLCNTLIEQPQEMAVTQTLMGSRFILPPLCRFLLSDISRLEPLLLGKYLYNLQFYLVWTCLPVYCVHMLMFRVIIITNSL